MGLSFAHFLPLVFSRAPRHHNRDSSARSSEPPTPPCTIAPTDYPPNIVDGVEVPGTERINGNVFLGCTVSIPVNRFENVDVPLTPELFEQVVDAIEEDE